MRMRTRWASERYTKRGELTWSARMSRACETPNGTHASFDKLSAGWNTHVVLHVGGISGGGLDGVGWWERGARVYTGTIRTSRLHGSHNIT